MKIRDVNLKGRLYFLYPAARACGIDHKIADILLSSVYLRAGLLDIQNFSSYGELQNLEFPEYVEEKDILPFLKLQEEYDLELLQIGGFLEKRAEKYFFDHLAKVLFEEAARMQRLIEAACETPAPYTFGCRPNSIRSTIF